MKKIVTLLILLMLMVGCSYSKIKYGTFEYERWGDQKIQGLSVTKDGDKIIVTLENQQSDGKALLEAIKIIKTLTVVK